MPRQRDQQHMTQLGHRLRGRRQWLELTQRDVAKAAGITEQMLQRYETGIGDPSSTMLLRLAAALSTTAAYLLGEGPGGRDPGTDEAAALFADSAVAAIMRRLKRMTHEQRRNAHALVATIGLEGCAIVGGDVITSVTITNPGSGYTGRPQYPWERK